MTNTKNYEIDINEVIASLELISESKAHLLTFVSACGYDLDHKEYKRINFLLKHQGDVNAWIELFSGTFDGDIEMVIETTDEFKSNKIEKMNISLDEFIVSCLSVEPEDRLRKLKNGLEDLFQVECNDEDFKKINEKLHNDELKLAFIYNKSKEDNWYNCVGKFARSNWKINLTA